jgi:outer membrane immunogenic protein
LARGCIAVELTHGESNAPPPHVTCSRKSLCRDHRSSVCRRSLPSGSGVHESSRRGPLWLEWILFSATGSNRLSGSGAIAGGQIGYNWTFSPQWLLGLEADWSYTGIRAAHDVANALPTPSAVAGFHSDLSSHWLATVRGRMGYTAGDWLMYGTAGLAIADLRTNDATSIPDPVHPFLPSSSSASSRIGWTAGGGVEYAFSRAWSAKAEYLYVDVKGNDYVVGPDGIFVNATIGVHHDDLREHLARVGINYHLGN